MKECARHGDRTQGPLACQADTLPMELPRPVITTLVIKRVRCILP